MDGGFTLAEPAHDRLLAARLADHRPFREPGTAYGYHAFVIGALTGEVVRRATGRSLQEIYEERVRAPHDLDMYLGLPVGLEARTPDMLPMRPTPQQQARMAANAPDRFGRAGVAFNLNAEPATGLVEFANTREVRALGPASSGGVGNARGPAGMYAAAISGLDGRPALLQPDSIAEFGRVHRGGTDLVTGEHDHFALGFEALGLRHAFLGDDAFGHGGAAPENTRPAAVFRAIGG